MKRTLLTLISIAFTVISIAQTKDYSEVIGAKTESITEVNSTKNSLWANTQTWANSVSTEYFKKVETADKENGTMILKVESYLPSGVYRVNEFSKIKVMMNIKIDCRDNKYRAIFSNFTSIIEPDRTVEVKNLTATQLTNMTNELERIVELSSRDFGKETIWSIDNIISAKNIYLQRNRDHKAAIEKQDGESKKGKKEVENMKSWIAGNNETIAFFDFILKGFGKKTDEIKKNINNSMNVSDNF